MPLDVDKIHDRAEPTYIPLARLTLWIASIILFFITATAVIMATVMVIKGWPLADATPYASVAVQACQILSIITLSILGYHGKKLVNRGG